LAISSRQSSIRNPQSAICLILACPVQDFGGMEKKKNPEMLIISEQVKEILYL
jgi:hypothetical protein